MEERAAQPHKKRRVSQSEIHCEICNQDFSEPWNLKRHTISQHEDSNTILEERDCTHYSPITVLIFAFQLNNKPIQTTTDLILVEIVGFDMCYFFLSTLDGIEEREPEVQMMTFLQNALSSPLPFEEDIEPLNEQGEEYNQLNSEHTNLEEEFGEQGDIINGRRDIFEWALNEVDLEFPLNEEYTGRIYFIYFIFCSIPLDGVDIEHHHISPPSSTDPFLKTYIKNLPHPPKATLDLGSIRLLVLFLFFIQYRIPARFLSALVDLLKLPLFGIELPSFNTRKMLVDVPKVLMEKGVSKSI